MNLRYLLIFPLLTGLFASNQLIAQSTSDLTPKYSNEFLTIGVGARGLGMSAAQVASVNDVTAGYWNPAGINGLSQRLQVAAMHSEYFAGIAKYDYAAVGRAIDEHSSAAFSVIRFGVDDIPNTTELIDAGGNIDYDRITKFSAVDYAFILSYGRKGLPGRSLTTQTDQTVIDARNRGEGFRWGVNAKIIYRHIGDFAQAWGFGIDAGVQYDRGPWHFGAVAKDITSTFNAWSYSLSDRTKEVFEATGNEIPTNGLEVTLPRIVAGAGRSFDFQKFTLLAEANATFTTDGKRNVLLSSNPVSIDPSMGFELIYNKIIFLRAGVGNAQRVSPIGDEAGWTVQPNMGLGLKIRNLQIDYALSDIGNVSDVLYSNVFSLRIDLVKKK